MQTQWNGDDGQVFFYQSETPYDVPSQGAWMNGAVNGFASYALGSGVTRHDAWGLGVYCFFRDDPRVRLASAIAAPAASGVVFHHAVTVSLGGNGEITHVVNGSGGSANATQSIAHLAHFP